MSGEATLSAESVRELDLLRERGCEVFGPGPMTRGETTPTAEAGEPLAGMHVQVRCGHRFVEGLGGTAEEAVRDALAKLGGYDPTGSVRG